MQGVLEARRRPVPEGVDPHLLVIRAAGEAKSACRRVVENSHRPDTVRLSLECSQRLVARERVDDVEKARARLDADLQYIREGDLKEG